MTAKVGVLAHFEFLPGHDQEISQFFAEGRTCDLVNIHVTKKVAPAGTAYTALVTAHCQPNGPVVQGERLTFEFYRYKGRLTVTTR